MFQILRNKKSVRIIKYAMATVDALVPKAFKVKDKEPEQLLIDYDVYTKTVNNFFIATGGQLIVPS